MLGLGEEEYRMVYGSRQGQLLSCWSENLPEGADVIMGTGPEREGWTGEGHHSGWNSPCQAGDHCHMGVIPSEQLGAILWTVGFVLFCAFPLELMGIHGQISGMKGPQPDVCY